MVIFLNMDGSCQKITPEHVYQGSNNVDDVTVVAPFAQSTALLIGFVLPNGLYWESPDGSRYAPMDYVPQSVDSKVGAWHYNLRSSVTQLMGELYVAINAVTAQGNTTSYMCKVFVEESVLPNLPAQPEPNVYDLILKYLGRVQGSLVANIEKVPGANNAIRYTDNFGVVSAPIVIGGGEDAPIPVNAASTVQIPKEAWQAQTDGYSYTLMAAMHGQMRDGATPNDLWVSFDETENSELQGVYADYSVAANGDITIVVNSPVDMTVRVWNGKGLVDEVARENVVKEEERATAAEAQLQQNIDAETQRAENAENAIRSDLVGMINAETQRATVQENNLQAQIDHIEQSGVDLTARAEIAQEVERATAAETAIRSDLQSEIKQEQQRAIQAEQGLQTQIANNTSDIQGLREDITEESHFRGMFNSVADLRAAYPTATPNDYAWIAGGNIWIWQDNAWMDSREPVPSTAVPASNATPLMDGTASAGTSNSYARGDHRHPSDSNKVSKSGDTMTGPLKVPALLASSASNIGQVVPFSMAFYSSPPGDPVKSMEEILKRIKSAYPSGREDKTFMGYVRNYWIGTYMANVYMDEEDSSQALPQYSSGILIIRGEPGQNSSHQAYLIGTENYIGRCIPLAHLDYVYSPSNPPPQQVQRFRKTVRINKTDNTAYGNGMPFSNTWSATICGYLGEPTNGFSFTFDSSALADNEGVVHVSTIASYNQDTMMGGGYVPLSFLVYHQAGSGVLFFHPLLDTAPNSMRGFATNGLTTFVVPSTVYPYFTSMTITYD